MIAGFVTLPSMLNAAQVLSFLPFFVVGLTLRPHHFAFLRRRAMRVPPARCCSSWAGRRRTRPR